MILHTPEVIKDRVPKEFNNFSLPKNSMVENKRKYLHAEGNMCFINIDNILIETRNKI